MVAGTMQYDGFGTDEPSTACPGLIETKRYYGRIGIVEEAAGSFAFDIDYRLDHDAVEGTTCTIASAQSAADYTGHVSVDALSTTWSGEGTVGDSLNGRVDARTEDEVFIASVCDNEAQSGRTIVTSQGHEAIVTYDGATTCDPLAAGGEATWTLDGVDMGTTSVSCSAAPGSRSGALGLIATALVGIAFVARRKRRGWS
jgi:hypothetical protein